MLVIIFLELNLPFLQIIVNFQVECHPYLIQRQLSDFCKKNDIVITAYSPLGSPDRPWAKPEDPKLMDDKKLIELSKKYGKTPAQILIRYQVRYICICIFFRIIIAFNVKIT